MRAIVFFFNDTATTEIYTLSLHDALPICRRRRRLDVRARLHLPPLPAAGAAYGARAGCRPAQRRVSSHAGQRRERDRKSTRLNSSHANISYAVFCLKKKKKKKTRLDGHIN